VPVVWKEETWCSCAEAGSICSTVSVVWKEDTVVFVRDRVRVERTALGIAGGSSKVVESAQDEASPTTLPGEPPEAKNFLMNILLEKFLGSCCSFVFAVRRS
jgi:hypothetical protein